MENFNNSIKNNSESSIADITQTPLFVIIIIIASIYIILVLSRKTLRSNKFNWLNVNVCFASTVFAVIQLLSIGIRLNNISETIISCRSKGFIVDMAACHIFYSHCIATFCRLLSVQYPNKSLFRSYRWLLSNIGVSWIIASCIALPYLFFDGFECSSSYGPRFLEIYSSLTTILMPIIIITVCNIILFRYVRQSTKRIRDLNNINTNSVSRRDRYLCKITLLTFCLFFIGWTPVFVEQLFFTDQNLLPSVVTTISKILPSTCVLADVILLIYSDHPARKLLVKAFTCHGIIRV